MVKRLPQSEKSLLNLIRINGPLSRLDISKLAGISITKVADATKNLEKKGFLQKSIGSSSGGRKPNLIKVKDDIGYSMGIEIGNQNTRIVVTNINGDILNTTRHYEPLKEKRDITLVDAIKLAEKALNNLDFKWKDLSTIGVGITGVINEGDGRILLLPNAPHWQNLEVVKELKTATGVKNIYLTDNVRAMALSESRYGSGKQFSNFILFYIGAGLGTGIIIDNKLLSGSGNKGIVGEIGHIYTGQNSEICVCGNYGCLESIASGRAIVNKAKRAITSGVFTSMSSLVSRKDSLQIQDITEAAQTGDKLAVNLIEETASHLAVGISTLINLLNPEAIIIAGGFADKAGKLLIDPLINGVKSKTLPWLRDEINIIQSEMGEYLAARGAATFAVDRAFNDLY